MVGLIGAMAVEIEALAEQMTQKQEKQIGMDTFISGNLFGVEAVLAVCGPGKVNAAICAQSMILTYHPKFLLNLGVAGAGADHLQIGDLVIATSCVQHDMDTSPLGDPVGLISKLNVVQLPCDDQLRANLVEASKVLTDAKIHQGVIATGDQFIHDAETRQRIHQQFSSLAVEMEGGAVAHVCYTHGIPCGVIRSISDKANGDADMDYPTFVKLAAEHSQLVVKSLLERIAE